MIIVLFCIFAMATSFDNSICPKHREHETEQNLTQRRLSVDEWKKCGPSAVSEFDETAYNATHKRISVPMRPSTPAEWAACPHQRNEGIKYAVKYCDPDRDGLICWEEVAQAKNDLLSTTEKVFLLFAAPELIMKHCAGDDGYISQKDFEMRRETCLRNCESVLNFYEYFVDRAVAKNYHPEPIRCSAKKTPELIEEGRKAVLALKDVYDQK